MRFTYFFSSFLLIYLSASSVYGDNYYWDIDVPVIESATNVQTEKLDRFSTITKSYDICIDSIENVAKFYDEFFVSLGWEDPLKVARSIDTQSKANWSARRLTFNDEDKPVAIYIKSWKSKNIPAKSSLQLTLTSYSEKGFDGQIKVVISPDIDMSPLIKINKLIGDNPKNLFLLYKAVKGNPFKIETITIPSSIQATTDNIVDEYYSLVKQIMESYSDFRIKYVESEEGKRPN